MTAWVAVALGEDVPAGTANPAVIGGREVVVWRSASGRPAAWVDRCPHRGMRFSFGFVRGETLSCLYHGWRFGADGGCKAIPAHPDLDPPATIRADAFAVAEADGLVWIWPEAGAEPAEPPPRLPGRTPVRSVTVARNEAAVASALGSAGAVRVPGGGFGLTVEGVPVTALLAAKTEAETIVHLLAGSEAAEDRRRVAAFGAAFRRRVESSFEETAA